MRDLREGRVTAYPATERQFRTRLAGAPVSVRSFSRPLERCSPFACLGMCCYDGVYLDDEAADVIELVVQQEGAFFRKAGLELPKQVVIDGDWRGMASGKKTAVRARPFSILLLNHPKHFNDTSCIFLLDDGRCGLQNLSLSRDLHPWYYKPFTCWLHPISVSLDEGGQICLPDEHSEPYRFEDYDGYVTRTFCGQTRACGRPAYEVLQEELHFLGRIIDRDLAGEIRQGNATP
ncbi:MAG: hypothetical protein HY675_13265 [Chloroflexi bacterium]|nr:hypothetical protein [Chloroflexota bacterium]